MPIRRSTRQANKDIDSEESNNDNKNNDDKDNDEIDNNKSLTPTSTIKLRKLKAPTSKTPTSKTSISIKYSTKKRKFEESTTPDTIPNKKVSANTKNIIAPDLSEILVKLKKDEKVDRLE